MSFTHRLKDFIRKSLYATLPGPLLVGYVRWRLPRVLNLESTTACNLACALCPTHMLGRSTRFLKDEHVQQILKGNHALRSVCFHVMGDPLIHPDLFDHVREFSSRGVETHFGTNGMRMVGKSLDEMIDSGLTSVSIALDGANAEDYVRYRRRGDFDTVVANTRALIERKKERGAREPRVQLQTIMFSYNEDNEDNVKEFLASFDADEVTLKRPSYFNDYDAWKSAETDVEPIKISRTVEYGEEFLETVDHEDDSRRYVRPREDSDQSLLRNQRMCPQLEKATILCDGRVTACCMDVDGRVVLGSLEDETLAEIWRGKKRAKAIQDFRERKMELCKVCDQRLE
ncbi:MAG: MoaA/NifB/PqqE/SkfB family radical SAM enzyme [Planctomycetota bacterium]|jgi:MoaA/NifB/PqqE/SkfB family radical SAM enzyme